MSTRQTLALTLLLALVAACKKDEPCNPGEEGLYLQSEWATYLAPGEYIPGVPGDSMIEHVLYHYDDNRRLKKIETSRTFDDSTRTSEFSEYQYDDCGTLERVDYTYSVHGLMYQTFSYNDTGQCTLIHSVYQSEVFDDSISNTGSTITIRRFRDGSATQIWNVFTVHSPLNITMAYYHLNPGVEYTQYFTYDDKINPRQKLHLPLGYNAPWDYSTNNIESIYESGDMTYITHTYNAEGYPLTEDSKVFSYIEQ